MLRSQASRKEEAKEFLRVGRWSIPLRRERENLALRSDALRSVDSQGWEWSRVPIELEEALAIEEISRRLVLEATEVYNLLAIKRLATAERRAILSNARSARATQWKEYKKQAYGAKEARTLTYEHNRQVRREAMIKLDEKTYLMFFPDGQWDQSQ